MLKIKSSALQWSITTFIIGGIIGLSIGFVIGHLTGKSIERVKNVHALKNVMNKFDGDNISKDALRDSIDLIGSKKLENE